MDTVDGVKGKDKLDGGKGVDLFMGNIETQLRILIHKKEIQLRVYAGLSLKEFLI